MSISTISKSYHNSQLSYHIVHTRSNFSIFCRKLSKTWLYTWPRGYKLFSCLTKYSIKFIMLINVKILTFMSMINKTSESLKARIAFAFQHFSFYEQLKVHAQLS